MEICEQRKLDPVETLGPPFVTVLRIHAQTQNLGLRRVELLEKSVQTRYLDASSGREIEWVRDEQYVLRATEIRKRHPAVSVTLELKIRCRGSSSDQRHENYLRIHWVQGLCAVEGRDHAR